MKIVKWYTDPQILINVAYFLTLLVSLGLTGEFAGMISDVVLRWVALGVAVLNIYIKVFVEQVKIARSLL